MKCRLYTKKKVQSEEHTTTKSTLDLSNAMLDTKSAGVCNRTKGLNQVLDKTKTFFILHFQVENILLLLNICSH